MIDGSIIETADGSSSIYATKFNASYHSLHGALQESRHVFIQQGLDLFTASHKIDLLEIGFGSGLNALLAWNWAIEHSVQISYTGIEAYPLDPEMLQTFSFGDAGSSNQFMQLHQTEWEVTNHVSPLFSIHKKKLKWPHFELEQQYDLLFYDAFAPTCQPELWEKEALAHCVNSMRSGGIWVSYCAKGEVRRTLNSQGCDVERLPGPPFKRHMLRARKH
jgi:tRNA U34 5-methylaminomethyl-2-thiouridine-forming methyltransferase MnmC